MRVTRGCSIFKKYYTPWWLLTPHKVTSQTCVWNFTSSTLYGMLDALSNWLDSSHANFFFYFCARIRSIFRSRDIFINIHQEITKIGNTVHSRPSYNAFCIFLFLFFVLFDTSPYRVLRVNEEVWRNNNTTLVGSLLDSWGKATGQVMTVVLQDLKQRDFRHLIVRV
jgi:hypothetical protein